MSRAKASPIDTVRNCTSANGCLNTTSDDRGTGTARGVVERAGGMTCARTPSSPALSRISAGGDAGCDGNDENEDTVADGQGDAPVVAGNAEPRPGRRYGDAHRHHGLPDAIEDAVYRSLQTKRHKHPGLGLNGCWPKCSAVAYKSFNDPGPTQCSKLRVYRPKTSSSAVDGVNLEEPAGRHAGGNESRPKTCVPVMTADQLTDIKLALCWDLDAPFDRDRPPDEPAVFHKVRQHQRPCGERNPQNSSAVMGFVTAAGNGDGHDAGDSRDVVPESRRVQSRECLLRNRNLSAVMELIPNKDRADDEGRGPAEPAERNDDVTAAVPDKPSSSRSSSSSTVRRCGRNRGTDRDEGKSNDDGRDATGNDDGGGSEAVARPSRGRRGATPLQAAAGHSSGRPRRRCRHEDAECPETAARSHHPQRRHACRPCLACDDPTAVAAANGRMRDHEECNTNHYKMAFKAGVPVKQHRAAAAGKPVKHLKVPKPKTTNSDKKKYVIGTLLPPFSMWPGTTARDYPEHWRLTSVYRQAFKPLELRKQPLLQTIYL